MRQQFIFYAIALFFIACNNSVSTEEKNVDPIVATSPGTDKIKDAVDPTSDSMALTTAEMKDDSVFVDGTIPASWANAGFSDPVEAKKFLKKLRYWAANSQKDSIATTIAYPLRKPVIKDKESFLKSYDNLFNEKVRKALREQNLSQLFRNAQGAMVGSGEIWINETPGGFKIIAINN